MWSLGVSKWEVFKMTLRFHMWTVGSTGVAISKDREQRRRKRSEEENNVRL